MAGKLTEALDSWTSILDGWVLLNGEPGMPEDGLRSFVKIMRSTIQLSGPPRGVAASGLRGAPQLTPPATGIMHVTLIAVNVDRARHEIVTIFINTFLDHRIIKENGFPASLPLSLFIRFHCHIYAMFHSSRRNLVVNPLIRACIVLGDGA